MANEFNHCPICSATHTRVLLDLGGQPSITSLGTLSEEEVVVFYCDFCGHAFNQPLSESVNYYSNDYTIAVNSDDEDQIVRVNTNGELIYRTQQQVETLLRTIEIPKRAAALDYGCAKGLTTQKLVELRPDLIPYLFDVTHIHTNRWEKIAPSAQTSINQTPPNWEGLMDVVFSMFTFEHMVQPHQALRHIHQLLKIGGKLHGVVPYVPINWADLIVRDHVHHYSTSSLRFLLAANSFEDIEFDMNSNEAALTFTAVKGVQKKVEPGVVESDEFESIAHFWSRRRTAIQNFESRSNVGQAAIYGAGVNGSFFLQCLRQPDNVRCFVDNSPHAQGSLKFNIPVLSPRDLPSDIAVVYIALRPDQATRVADDLRLMRPSLKVFI